MEAKNTGAIMVTIFFILLCAIIGSCFMAFVYEEKKITITDPKIVSADGIEILDSEGNAINELKLSTSKLGIKPVTGEEDSETDIPSTVTNSNGSEGLYATFKLKSDTAWKLYITNINIESESDAEGEREHIKVGLLDVKDSVQTLEGDKILIASGEATTEPMEFTFLFWLHSHAGDELIGSTISFELLFEIA